MPTSITPVALGEATYTIAGSARAVAELSLTFPLGETYMAFALQYPTGTAGVQVMLQRGALSLNLLPGPLNNDTTFPERLVSTELSTVGADTRLDCILQGVSTSALSEAYTLRLRADAATTWRLEQLDNNPASLTVTRLMGEPTAAIAGVSTSVREKSFVSASAGPAAPAGVVVGPLPPTFYRWSYTGDIAVSGLPVSGASPTLVFTTPGVYGPRAITLRLEVWFEGEAATPGFLRAEASQPLTIEPRPHHLVLVLDRSGSMAAESRWQSAVTAARMVGQAFVALRSGVSPVDRMGIMVFEDTGCSWRPFLTSFTPDSAIQNVLTLNPVDNPLKQGICDTALGRPGSCTPIGDALLRAMVELHALASEVERPRFTIVLLTDGYENSGSVYLKSTPSALAAGAVSFASRRGATVTYSGTARDLSRVNNDLVIYPIGLGATVDSEVLNALPSVFSAGTAYLNVTDVGQLKAAFAQMFGFAQDAQAVATASTPGAVPGTPCPADPDSATVGPSRYFSADVRVNRLLAAVEWAPGSNSLALARYDSSQGRYLPLAAAPALCERHGFVSVDLAALHGGEVHVPQTYWRLTHTVSGAAQPIADSDTLVYVDMYVKADVSFDRRAYRTDEELVITARLRAGSEPIRHARVLVELERPGQSLGSFLALNNRLYRPGSHQSPDPRPPKEDMLAQLLEARRLPGLGVKGPPGLFTDGTSELLDDGAHRDGQAGDGDYANVFAGLDKEGVYTFRLLITGTLPDGSTFNRVLVLSTWASLTVDPSASPVSIIRGGELDVPPGQVAVRLEVTPRSSSGEYLGPFHEDEVRFHTTAGTLERAVASQPDGRYTQVLRYKRGERPRVSVEVQGKRSEERAVDPLESAWQDMLDLALKCCKRACRCLERLRHC